MKGRGRRGRGGSIWRRALELFGGERGRRGERGGEGAVSGAGCWSCLGLREGQRCGVWSCSVCRHQAGCLRVCTAHSTHRVCVQLLDGKPHTPNITNTTPGGRAWRGSWTSTLLSPTPCTHTAATVHPSPRPASNEPYTHPGRHGGGAGHQWRPAQHHHLRRRHHRLRAHGGPRLRAAPQAGPHGQVRAGAVWVGWAVEGFGGGIFHLDYMLRLKQDLADRCWPGTVWAWCSVRGLVCARAHVRVLGGGAQIVFPSVCMCLWETTVLVACLFVPRAGPRGKVACLNCTPPRPPFAPGRPAGGTA